ncbi:MAG: isochorismatase family cysteine hydrolase [Bryobacteraceae bacterium]|jgi:nicotinamidase/pyrazinamidase
MRTVFFDIDTQLDFVSPAGALYAPGAERVIAVVARLNRHAASSGIVLVSTTDAHAENDAEFAQWPPHCVAGTLGQRKPQATLIEKSVVVPNRGGLPDTAGAAQIIVEKQTVDVFETRTIAPLLERLGADRFVVYGVVTEVCVWHAARGLLRLGKPVTIATDAVQALRPEAGERALAELRAAGATLATISEVLSGELRP